MKSRHQLLGAVVVISTVVVSGSYSPAYADGSPLIPNLNGFLSIQNSGRDFFEAGREKLEKEVKIIYRGELASDEKLLTVNEDVIPPEQEEILPIPDSSDDS